MSCNVPEHGDEFFLVVVSIPIGFSNELQRQIAQGVSP